MESLLQQLERFSEVLAVARTPHVRSWEPATVRRAFQWARYVRHIHRRFSRHVHIRTVLERRLQSQWQVEGDAGPASAPGLTNFHALGCCDLLLSQRLLENPALGHAAFHSLVRELFPGPGVLDAEKEMLQSSLALHARRRSAVHLLLFNGHGGSSDPAEDPLIKTQAELLLRRLREVGRAAAEGPRRLLGSLWERSPRSSFLEVTAAALLLPASPGAPEDELEPGSSQTPPGDGARELVHWLLGKSDTMATFCRSLPAGLLTSVASRHPEFFQAYLGLLTNWGRRLHYDLQKGVWVAAEAQDVPWEELCGRFQSLCQAPSPLKDEVLTALESRKAQDGDFEVRGVSIWTDLLLALEGGA